MHPDRSFWEGRRVLLTGHTGFKGAWAALWLNRLGARVTGLALPPETDPSLWKLIGDGLLEQEMIADITDEGAIAHAIAKARPSLVIHMAAQSLVRASYEFPVKTFATNLLGSVHVMEALRTCEDIEAALIVTTDKVYANNDSGKDFVEHDPLGGHDPYSASKACVELAVASYAEAFFRPRGVPLATARAGNVIGGGDWSPDRLVPDVWRAVERGEPLKLRNPESTRPWQHVLEPLAGYFLYLEALAAGRTVPKALNFGPPAGTASSVSAVAEIMTKNLGAPSAWTKDSRPAPQEMKLLSLDPSSAIASLGWRPRLSCEDAVQWTASWYAQWKAGSDPVQLCQSQIEHYETLA